MLPSYEVRWFFEEEPYALAQWFQHKGMAFAAESPSRNDHYLPLAAKKGLGIKLREGNLEIKQLVKSSGRKSFILLTITGRVQQWVKWVFNLQEKDPVSTDIISRHQYDWVEVAKDRLGFKYSLGGRGKRTTMVGIKEIVPEGCQVEYTRILIKDRIYYSFGLEAFSETGREKQNFSKGSRLVFKEMKEWNSDKVNDFMKIHLALKDSMGYPEFLEKIAG